MTWTYPSQHLIKSVEYSDLKFKKVNRKENRKENVGGRNIARWKSYLFFFKAIRKAHLRRR